MSNSPRGETFEAERQDLSSTSSIRWLPQSARDLFPTDVFAADMASDRSDHRLLLVSAGQGVPVNEADAGLDDASFLVARFSVLDWRRLEKVFGCLLEILRGIAPAEATNIGMRTGALIRDGRIYAVAAFFVQSNMSQALMDLTSRGSLRVAHLLQSPDLWDEKLAEDGPERTAFLKIARDARDLLGDMLPSELEMVLADGEVTHVDRKLAPKRPPISMADYESIIARTDGYRWSKRLIYLVSETKSFEISFDEEKHLADVLSVSTFDRPWIEVVVKVEKSDGKVIGRKLENLRVIGESLPLNYSQS